MDTFFLDREGRLRDRALFDLAIDSKLRDCDLVKIMIGDLVRAPTYEPARLSCSRKRVDRFSSNLRPMFAQACFPGLRDAAARRATSSFQAGLTTRTT